jgi:hypothetical protein
VGSLTRVPFDFPLISNFIRRSFCDASPDGIAAFHVGLRTMIAEGLARLEAVGEIAPTPDSEWRATQVMMVIFGSAVLDPPAREDRADEDAALTMRTRANIRVLTSGLRGTP